MGQRDVHSRHIMCTYMYHRFCMGLKCVMLWRRPAVQQIRDKKRRTTRTDRMKACASSSRNVNCYRIPKINSIMPPSIDLRTRFLFYQHTRRHSIHPTMITHTLTDKKTRCVYNYSNFTEDIDIWAHLSHNNNYYPSHKANGIPNSCTRRVVRVDHLHNIYIGLRALAVWAKAHAHSISALLTDLSASARVCVNNIYLVFIKSRYYWNNDQTVCENSIKYRHRILVYYSIFANRWLGIRDQSLTNRTVWAKKSISFESTHLHLFVHKAWWPNTFAISQTRLVMIKLIDKLAWRWTLSFMCIQNDYFV